MSEGDTEHLWPDDLELDDRLGFDGDEYVVVGTGPGEATLDRVDDESVTIEVFRWAITNAVGIELETSLTQEEFERSVDTATDRDRAQVDIVKSTIATLFVFILLGFGYALVHAGVVA